jgi:glutamine---fructose-6-phosphate transaminase (isomerizing)
MISFRPGGRWPAPGGEIIAMPKVKPEAKDPKPVPGKIMLSEIQEQPEAIARLLERECRPVWEMAQPWRETPPRFIFIAARGTSDHAALFAKYLFETMNGIPVGLASPSIASIYRAKVNMEGALIVGISQSGEAADVISVIQSAKRAGVATLAITNAGSSKLAAAAQQVILLHAEPEKAVAATKTFTSTLAALTLLSAAIGDSGRLLAQLRKVPQLIESVINEAEQIQEKVERFRFLEECVVLGRGYNLANSYELALKLRETCYVRAQAYASPDFLHGPIAILEKGYPVMAFANKGASLFSVLDVILQAKARGAEVVVFGNAPEALSSADVAFPVNIKQTVPEVISPFPGIVAGQLFSETLSLLKGINPDRPRGLHKVTVTL